MPVTEASSLTRKDIAEAAQRKGAAFQEALPIMKVELWFSEQVFSFTLFEQGNTGNHAAREPDARRLAIFEAASWEDAKHQQEQFLRGPNGFLSTYPGGAMILRAYACSDPGRAVREIDIANIGKARTTW